MLREIPQTLGPWRNETSGSLWLLFILDGSKTAIHLLLLRLDKRCGGKSGGKSEETAAGRSLTPTPSPRERGMISFIVLMGIYSSLSCRAAVGEAYGPMLAVLDAIHTSHTTVIVDAMVLGVDTRSLALLGTSLASIALRRVDNGTEKGEAREKAQYSAHGTDGVAISASACPCQYRHDNKRDGSHDGDRRQRWRHHARHHSAV